MSLPERLAAYREYRLIRCTDPRWEAILADLRAGVILVHRPAGSVFGWIEVCA